MEIKSELLLKYKKLMQTTNIQESYQEIIKFIKHIRANLVIQMDDYDFSSKVVENQMDFSYFQATKKALKEKGLKIQVVFIHKSCLFEVWMSGYNRAIQCKYNEMLATVKCPYERCENPEKNDFIVKIPVKKSIGLDQTESMIEEMEYDIRELETFFEDHKINVYKEKK